MASTAITRGLDHAEQWTQRWLYTRIGMLVLVAIVTAWAIAYAGTLKGNWSPGVMIAATLILVRAGVDSHRAAHLALHAVEARTARTSIVGSHPQAPA